jgi:hypothetical protein
MEDIEVGTGPVARNYPAPPWATPSGYHASSYSLFKPASMTLSASAADVAQVNFIPQAVSPASAAQSAVSPTPAVGTEPALTVLAMTGGEAFLAREYWVQDGQVHCVLAEGEQKSFPLEQMDLYQTANLNRQRNIKFVLQARDAGIQ